jgi:hypothetical protein
MLIHVTLVMGAAVEVVALQTFETHSFFLALSLSLSLLAWLQERLEAHDSGNAWEQTVLQGSVDRDSVLIRAVHRLLHSRWAWRSVLTDQNASPFSLQHSYRTTLQVQLTGTN